MIGFLGAVLAWATSSALGPASLTDTGVRSPSSDAASFEEASAAFDARLRTLHPPGSGVADLRRALATDGFVIGTVTEGEGVAVLERSGFLCLYDWTVRWAEEAGRLTELNGEHGGQCM